MTLATTDSKFERLNFESSLCRPYIRLGAQGGKNTIKKYLLKKKKNANPLAPMVPIVKIG